MGEEILEVTIRPDGRVEMHVRGIEGMACLAETEELLALLGGEIQTQELTGEAYVEVSEEQQDRLWH